VDALADLVQLPRSVLGRTPDRLSGGQCQRVAIARALATDPAALVCDEVVSALDHSAKHLVIDLLRELRAALGLAVVFITHDLSAAAELTDRLVVLRDGLVVEEGPTAALLSAPRHPHTRELVAATPPPVTPSDHAPSDNAASDNDREQTR
jgi:peptide/nickel transport system ATP-binding protein